MKEQLDIQSAAFFDCVSLINTLNITPSADGDFLKKKQNMIRDHIIKILTS